MSHLVVRDSANFPADVEAPVVTIGNFDGVHRGHQALLRAAKELAKGGPVCAYTFDPSPRDVMVPGHGVPYIQSVDDRVRTLHDCGADYVVLETFTKDFSRTEARDYAVGILGGRLRARGVVVGWDFRFGKGRAGDAAVLRRLLDIPVVQVGAVAFEGQAVSSTRVRQAVRSGDVGLASRLLTRPHELVGTVVRGDARGRTIGFPTANLVPGTQLVPPAGVYAVTVTVGDERYGGVANLGVRPTFEPGSAPLEVHLFDFDGELYGTEIRVGLLAHLRAERKFDGVDALVTQIRKDAEAARAVLSRHA